MGKLKHVSLLVLLSMLLGLLAACGGETPTNTPVPPPPTNTPAPPTNTPVPPPTNTTAPAAAATGTPAAGNSGTGSGSEASPADLALITEALTATQQLKSYHFTLKASGDIITQTLNLEGDYVAPDKAYAKGTVGDESVEQLATGNKIYRKDASGKWVETPESVASGGAANPAESVVQEANVVGSLSTFTNAGANYRNVGTETLDGVSTTHFAGTIEAGKMQGAEGLGALGNVPSLGTVNVWIDPQTKYIHKLDMNLDLSTFMEAINGISEALQGTPTPGGPTATAVPSLKFAVNLTVSKPNDPSITVPTP
jgi:LppX/LprAFG-like lipoprotein